MTQGTCIGHMHIDKQRQADMGIDKGTWAERRPEETGHLRNNDPHPPPPLPLLPPPPGRHAEELASQKALYEGRIAGEEARLERKRLEKSELIARGAAAVRARTAAPAYEAPLGEGPEEIYR